MQLRALLITPLILTILFGCSEDEPGEVHTWTNALVHESSAYLQQHAHNPVDWFPWNKKAIDQAQKEDKLMVISIGYSSCHWCHVMEKECFEDTTVARAMNASYVSIKVDREERPDIDERYMKAALLMNGSGGWPLNVIALPDGRPVFAGTYFPKSDWLEILAFYSELYQNDPAKLQRQADLVESGLFEPTPAPSTSEINVADEAQNIGRWSQFFDRENGGLVGEQKFPNPAFWNTMLHMGYSHSDSMLLNSLSTTLDHLCFGGMYDHVGGGFFRYTVDPQWHIPHFEKMLYDNAQLVSLVAQACEADPREEYRQVVMETLDFIEREMTGANGEFYASLDADSDGKEGAYYTWDEQAFSTVCKQEASVMKRYFHVSRQGSWEGTNVLYCDRSPESFARAGGIDPKAFNAQLKRVKKSLFDARSQRTPPHTETKCITAWNALMLQGYIDAYKAFGEPKYLECALRNAQFLRDKRLEKDGSLWRIKWNEKSGVRGFLEDYANLSLAYLELYQVTFDKQWLTYSEKLLTKASNIFRMKDSPFLAFSENDLGNLGKGVPVEDGIFPSPNSTIARCYQELGNLLYRPAYIDRANEMLRIYDQSALQNPFTYGSWLKVRRHFSSPSFTVAIVGDNWQSVLKKLQTNYLPQCRFVGATRENGLEILKGKYTPGKTMIYICIDNACLRPVTSVDEALRQIRSY